MPTNKETDATTIKARAVLAHYNQDRPEHKYSCPSCGQDFDTTEAIAARDYNRHAETCQLLRSDAETE